LLPYMRAPASLEPGWLARRFHGRYLHRLASEITVDL